MSIRCGHCKGSHASVEDVKACSRGSLSLQIKEAREADPMAQAAAYERGENVPAPVVKLTGPNSVSSPAPIEVTEGFYKIDGTDAIYKVQRAVHGSGHLYAKRLVVILSEQAFGDADTSARWEYAPGVMPMIRLDGRPLTRDEAAAFGKLYGVCCICGRTLTNEGSIEAGIGPICAGKQGWA